MNRVRSQIEVWSNDLLDLTRRNTALYYRKTKRSTLEVVSPDPGELVTLLGKGKALTFFEPPPPPEKDSGEDPWTVEDSLEAAGDRELATDKTTPSDLSATLRNIHRAATLDFLDRGLQTLYLGVGLLHWQEPKKGDPAKSFLLYLPVELSRASSKEKYQLKLAEEDVVLNIALQVVFSEQYGIELGDISLDAVTEPGELEKVFQQVASRFKGRDWHIEPLTALMRATFFKEAMFADLRENQDEIAVHPLVNALVDGENALEEWDQPLPLESMVDDLAPPEKSYAILDADSSQRAAVHASVQGMSFVMDGPPGTGKSQTISNMIAELMARGKTILFVSEKAAALDVVYNRLQQRGLDDFLLQLHSHKATRKEVVKALNDSLMNRPRSHPGLSENDLATLKLTREELSRYAAAVNERREPLGKPLIDVFGRLAQLDQAATPPGPDQNDLLAWLSASKLSELRQMFDNLATVWRSAADEQILWNDLERSDFSDADRTQITKHLTQWSEALEKVEELSDQLALDLKVPAPENFDEIEPLLVLAKHMERKPKLTEKGWLDTPSTTRQTVLEMAAVFQDIQQSRTKVGKSFRNEFVETQDKEGFDQLRNTVKEIVSDPNPLSLTNTSTLQQFDRALEALRGFNSDLDEVKEAVESLLSAFNLDGDDVSLRQLVALATLVQKSDTLNRPEPDWCSSAQTQKVAGALNILQPMTERYRDLKSEVAQTFEDALLEQDLNGMVIRFEKTHVGVMKYFRGIFWTDRKVVKNFALDRQFSTENVKALATARELQSTLTELRESESRHEKVLGRYYEPLNSRCEDAREALSLMESALELLGTHFSKTGVQQSLTGEAPSDKRLIPQTRRLGERLNQIEAAVTRAPFSSAGIEGWSYEALRHWVSRCLEWGEQHRAELAPVLQAWMQPATATFADLKKDLDLLALKLVREDQFAKAGPYFEKTFGEMFRGQETDWSELRAAVDWLEDLHKLMGTPSKKFRQRHIGGDAPDSEALRYCWQQIEGARKAVMSLFTEERRAHLFSEYLSDFEGPEELVEGLLGSLDDLFLWNDYIQRWVELEDEGLLEALHFCFENSVSSEHLPNVLEKAVLAAYVQTVLSGDARLRKYRAEDREQLVAQFRQLDQKLIVKAAEEVVRACNDRRPQTVVGPAGTIKREAEKKNRHMPVRALLAQTVDVVTRLKPCFMMSPLSVSQYLPPNFKFDVVIFDEASQVRPSDAINCVYRGNQLIVAGDEKQLPPTNFFQTGSSNDEEGYDEEQLDEFESLLTQCRGAGYPQLPLRWHYRSRNEDLITFSNRRFYSPPGLVTFPSPREGGDDGGVQFIRAQGVYRQGTTRDNPEEARLVAQRVFHHLRRDPSLSIGAIAFSSAQESAIERAVMELLEENPDLEKHLHAEDRLEGFFVKNLESVQGDERDIIIFSVGYGPNEDGKMAMRFGPLNNEGGWKRLNVAITRARRKVEVVASFSPREHNADGLKNRGARELMTYLRYAESGPAALAVDHFEQSHETESPFEEAVCQLIRSWGYDVVPQVGTAGFRVDLGVRHPERPGEYILGIECDGAMYHSSKVARDRDRLRQQVLENLGWRIFRIWGGAWYRDRKVQEGRLKEALERAVREGPVSLDDRPAPELEVSQRDSVEVELSARPEWAEVYRVAGGYYTSVPTEPESAYEVDSAIREVLRVEAPITVDFLTRRIAGLFDTRKTKKLGRVVEQRLRGVLVDDTWERQGETIFRRNASWTVRVPIPDYEETVRGLHEFPPEEVELALELLLKDATRATSDELMNHLRTLFGFGRTGAKMRNIFEMALDSLEESGRILRGDGGEYRSPGHSSESFEQAPTGQSNGKSSSAGQGEILVADSLIHGQVTLKVPFALRDKERALLQALMKFGQLSSSDAAKIGGRRAEGALAHLEEKFVRHCVFGLRSRKAGDGKLYEFQYDACV